MVFLKGMLTLSRILMLWHLYYIVYKVCEHVIHSTWSRQREKKGDLGVLTGNK
jgi:hypothetical protein